MSTESADPDRPARPAAHAVAPPSSSSTRALLGVLLAGMAGMAIFLFVHLSNDGRLQAGPKQAHAECTRGQRDCLPDVNYVDTAGVAYSRDTLAGKVVVVNFWATWCHPCQMEIPDLSRMYDKYKGQGLVMLGIMTDNNPVDSQQLLNFQSDYGMTYPVVRANSDLMVSYNYPEAIPTTFVFDRSGKQVLSHVGPLHASELDSLLGQLIAQK